ncbi:hypothetical protein N7517_001403 [Penicillium concentricum]|uniref:Uncharacterized protein n=1 Tax=Penicillium concentricum TaxID=293559 RepID=A0A9W9SRZ3_9EURO|nr:uncharacterized protein N7517_001403 [Penicillium concentricum]KAJ5383492.1 hypothetical protein N7517_001403 [Penicillium concentricum]
MSTALNIPQAGLSLHLGDQSGDPSVKPNQIMRLNLVQSTLDDLIESLRKDQPARVRLGKHPSLHYGGKTQMFHAYPETHRSEIYHSSSDKETLYFTGVLSHSLEVEKAKNATAATDQALADLEEKLNAHERGKESKKTHIISHPDELKALRGSKAGYKGPTTKVELEKDRFLKTAANRSLTASPVLGAPKSPSLAMTPTSAPVMQSKDRARLDALKIPFIHLLAVRAVSAKFLARQTRSTVEDCIALGEKFGVVNRINPEKYNLKDKVYKDLDLFGFNYTEEDRKEAIENSISAFDRMRISRSDKLWQTLLPKGERGKGKCLSRLNLRTGPPQKPAGPLAKASGEDSGKDNETDHATKGPAPATKTTSASQKARDKDVTKRPTKTKNTNSTLTGRVTKKTGGKAPVKVDSKIKSAEFVHSSDEDDDTDMPDVPPAAPAPAPTPAPKQQPKEHKRTPSSSKPPAPKIKAPAKPRTETTSVPSAPAPKAKAEAPKPKLEAPKLEPSKPVTKVTASKRPPSRPSTSPQKPSPLGSSPPANVSDAASSSRNRSDSQNQSSGSSSSSPLISQLAKTTKVGRIAPAAGKTVKTTSQANGITKATSSTTNPLKRKAESDQLSVAQAGRPNGNLEAKRRRAISSSSGGSTGSASPPMSYEILRQQLREKSQKFKNFYTKYRNLHDSLAALPNPPQVDLDKLQKQHTHLQRMKKEIWEEDRQLRDGLHS